MEYVKAVIGGMEMYVPVNNKLGNLILIAQRRVNFQRHVAKMRKEFKGKIKNGIVIMDSDYIYALEDVADENGYDCLIHRQFEKCSLEQRKILYDLFRSDKTMRYLITVYGYKQEQVESTVRSFFEALKKIIF